MRKSGFLLFGLVVALLLSQFPEFFQQYTQRLGGRLDEVTAQVGALERRAAEAGKDLPDYLGRFLRDPDTDVQREGQTLVALLERRSQLRRAYAALTGTDRWWRAATFVQHFDWEIGQATAESYQPALPLTAESAVYAGAGFGSGAGLFWLLFGGRRRRQRRAG